eukprot:gb/GEZN01001239.1/.p1 GENE.gb/GEZN01001239.1/~~gb/GEZN01001239.1/.p1  ORF type:complete len:897 (-),score=15.03 gb/GEZN01001239.1/:413-3103(-)
MGPLCLLFWALIRRVCAEQPLDVGERYDGFEMSSSASGLWAVISHSLSGIPQLWAQVSDTVFDFSGFANDTTYVVLELSQLPKAFDFTVEALSGPEAGRLYRLTEESLDKNRKLVTQPIPGSSIRLTLNAPGHFVVDSIILGSANKAKRWGPQQESVCSRDDTQNVRCWGTRSPVYITSKPVARIVISSRFLCTGTLIHSLNVLLTNYHCVTSQADVDATKFEWMAETESCSAVNYQMAGQGSTVLQGGTYLGGDSTLDFALVQLKGAAVSSMYGTVALDFDSNSALSGTQIYIPQHPNGFAKMVGFSIDNGQPSVLTAGESPCSGGSTRDLGYMTDTLGGSSGSPVISYSTNKMIGLHHCGGCPNRAVPMSALSSVLTPTLASKCFSSDDCRGSTCSWSKVGDVGTCANDRCAANPCQNGGQCLNSGSSYVCSCVGTGYQGSQCQTNENDCSPNPCLHGGRCTDGFKSYSCECSSTGYTGTVCQTNINDCLAGSCLNGGRCVDGINTYTCDCSNTGFTGNLCQTNIDDCSKSSCLNGGRCIDALMSYTCDCSNTGYTGSVCQTSINDCQPNPCANGGTCVDGINNFSCSCPSRFYGSACENVNGYCKSNPCWNGGTCKDFVDHFECLCLPGFAGTVCKTEINECASGPCLNGGLCLDMINRYLCRCPTGFQGSNCEIDQDECKSSPCENGATCKDGPNRFICNCLAGYGGTRCETDVDECKSNPCMNGGTCANGINNFTCHCVDGYEGTRCETDYDDCISGPCLNNATCVDGVGEYTCNCASGWEGTNCESPKRNFKAGSLSTEAPMVVVRQLSVSFCKMGRRPNPCLNGGKCRDGSTDYYCSCSPGYVGSNCEIDVDDCAMQPCLNGGTCLDIVNGYKCTCPSGWDGEVCSQRA